MQLVKVKIKNFLSIKNPYVTDVEETMEFGKTKELTDYIANSTCEFYFIHICSKSR